MHMKYGIPGEYRCHYGTIVMYPTRQDIWRDGAAPMQKYICDLVDIMAKYEQVFLFCQDSHFQDVHEKFRDQKNVTVISSRYDDIWARDVCPTFVLDDDGIRCVDWKFNSWGGKKEGAYYPWDADDAFPKAVSDYFRLRLQRVNIVLEGGAIATDGNGTLFSTRSVVMNRNRNPFLTREYITEMILNATDEKQMIWLTQGLASDETNGHVDNILAFVNSKELVLAWTDDRSNPNYERVRAAYDILSNTTSSDGRKYIIHKIPLPPSQYMNEAEANGLISSPDSLPRKAGDLLPASYINFYLLNGAVLIPSFHCETDEEARKIFERLFPHRDIIQIYSREPLLGGGGIHCLLHEIPLEVI